MELKIRGEHALRIVVIDGDLDLRTCPRVTAVLRKVTKPGPRAIVLILSKVRHVDFGGVATLLQAGKDARRHGTALYLMAPPEPLLRLLRMAGVQDLFPVCHSLESLRARLPARSAPAPGIETRRRGLRWWPPTPRFLRPTSV